MAATTVDIDGKKVKLTNLDKVLYPKAGFTKAHVIDYYRRIAPVLLPHLQDRPITLKRYPDGVEGSHFYERNCPSHRPDWMATMPVWSESSGREVHYCVLDDLASLVWAANMADLELHTFLHMRESVDRPTSIVFDLDPGLPAGLAECAQVALDVRDILNEFDLKSFPKTSGSKGMQMHVPLNTDVTYDDTKPFARAVADVMEREHPRRVTSNMRKELRSGKVFIDWSQNHDHKTTVCVYSLRAKKTPTVSMPLAWSEVEVVAATGDASRLWFGPDEAVMRAEELGDLYAPVLDLQQVVPTLADR